MFSLADYIPKEEIAKFCRKNHITKLSLFGSALRDELRPDSDIDILVEFEKKHIPGLITFCGMQNELYDIMCALKYGIPKWLQIQPMRAYTRLKSKVLTGPLRLTHPTNTQQVPF